MTLIRPDVVVEWGGKVRPCEETAMRLVKEHASHIPIPELYRSTYSTRAGAVVSGELYMALVPGSTLKSVWAEFDDKTKGAFARIFGTWLPRFVPFPALSI